MLPRETEKEWESETSALSRMATSRSLLFISQDLGHAHTGSQFFSNRQVLDLNHAVDHVESSTLTSC